ncbi:MAG: DUF6164 family protein [Sulfuricella sp.]|nr:DUF6164 family protein [Sulfuricella sp.]
MPIKLFRLNHVPDDEAEEIRTLLTGNEIDFYETSPGIWGISVAAIWLRDEDQYPRARSLIDEYQNERLVRVREEYAHLQREGRNRTVIDLIRENPVRFVVYLVAISAVIYFSTKPFIDIGK